MDRKIGRIVFLFFIVCFSLCADEIALQALDMNGKTIRQVVATVPFILQACVSSQNSIPGAPHIAGLEHVSVDEKGHVSTINSIINGIRSTKKIYQYHVVIDKPGIHTFGPALLVSNRHRLQSNTLTLEVVDEQTGPKLAEPFISLSVDKKDVVVGEPVYFTIRFYPIKSINLEGISEPIFKNFSATSLEGPYSGSENKSGEYISYIEWRNKIYPKKAGKLKIPSVTALYKTQRKFKNNALDMFDRLFDGGLDKKQICSNALMITVHELPEHDTSVTAIGKFHNITASVDHAQAQEGEGIVYSLVIQGEGDLQAIAAPPLSMPEGLKFYESKNSIDQAKNKKTFEYIVQGIKPGIWEIPSQQFTFFDLDTRMYKTIESKPINVEIFAENKQNIENFEQSEQKKEPNETLPLQLDGPWNLQKEHSISWILFFCSIILCFLLPGFRFYQMIHMHYAEKNQAFQLKKNAFKQAKKALSYAFDVNDVQALHTIFINLFSHRLMIPLEQLNQELIENSLKEHAISKIDEWHRFFTIITQYKFFDQYNAKNDEQIFIQAKGWLEVLEKKL